MGQASKVDNTKTTPQKHRRNVSYLTAPTAPTAEELVALLLSQHLKESRFTICKKINLFHFCHLEPHMSKCTVIRSFVVIFCDRLKYTVDSLFWDDGDLIMVHGADLLCHDD